MNGGFVTEFLFGDTRVATDTGRATVRMHLDERTEGWVGIPHGGIGMGSLMELASFLEDGPRDADGNQIIHLMVRGEALVKVRVSRATNRVEIGTSCDTLEMH